MVVSAELNDLIFFGKKRPKETKFQSETKAPTENQVTTKKAQSDESQGVVSSTQGLMLISSDCNWTQLRI